MEREDSSFFSRWSRRKAQARAPEAPLPPEVPAVPEPPAVAEPPAACLPAPGSAAAPQVGLPAADVPPPPTLDDVATLTPTSDFSRFVMRDVQPDVRNAALKKLFADPHYNVMDGLDTYIDDYGKPDPLPPGMLRQMVQSWAIGLFDDEKPAPTESPAAHEDTDLQLQPDDGAGLASPGPGPAPDAGREP
jgi:hypothetical protein